MLAGLPGDVAMADSGTDAAQTRAQATAAAARVTALQPRVQRALRAYERALAELGSGVSRSISAQQAVDQAAVLDAAEQQAQDNRVRALYMSGGTSALLVTVLSASSAGDALRRATVVQRLIAVGAHADRTGAERTMALQHRADALQQAAEATTVTAADVARRYDALTATLAQATGVLTRLSQKARQLEAAQAAAAQLSALNAAVAAAGQERVASAHASATLPADYHALYLAAAHTCAGMSWGLLAAIGQVESGHGANTSTSYAGAQGPMQFLPSTFASYAVDGDHDGITDIQDPADAVFTAAHYLCANGAGRDPQATARAVWHYNHADWYVALVLKLAGEYDTGTRPAPSS
ncbi:MAG TPA: lytic murein transglycosylase [Actinomycetes bacterium]|nr:lytic murein transglycosylase [Actinomycetes bacterium]